MKILLASNNMKKLKELQQILSDSFEIVTLSQAGVQSDPEETGATFAENAYIKALSGMQASGLPCLADDSGLAVDALNGAPGVFSARYAGEHGDDEANNRLLLKNMENITDRRAKFVSAVCLVYPDKRVVTAVGEVVGQILYTPRGENGFGYDPLFYVQEYQKTFAELTAQQKNAISQPARALRQLAQKLGEQS